MYAQRLSTGKRLTFCFVLAGLLLVVAACGGRDFTAELGTLSAKINVVHLVPQVLSVRPHDTTSFTEGLVLHAGSLYESAGLYGESSLSQIDLKTGKILRRIVMPPEYFGEGLALAGDRLIQLTYHEQVAFIFDVNTFAKVGE